MKPENIESSANILNLVILWGCAKFWDSFSYLWYLSLVKLLNFLLHEYAFSCYLLPWSRHPQQPRDPLQEYHVDLALWIEEISRFCHHITLCTQHNKNYILWIYFVSYCSSCSVLWSIKNAQIKEVCSFIKNSKNYSQQWLQCICSSRY